MTDRDVPSTDPILTRPWGRYGPRAARIVHTEPLGEGATLVDLAAECSTDPAPGQYLQLVAPGTGEVPAAVASVPNYDGRMSVLVRDVGGPATTVRQASPGDEVGIRGPFGKGFGRVAPGEDDLLLVARGPDLAVLRPFVQRALAATDGSDELTLLYAPGSAPDDVFRDDLERWRHHESVGVHQTDVVHRNGGATAALGDLVADVTLDPSGTVALVGGSATYDAVSGALADRGLTGERVLVSMADRMACGVGACGRCQDGEHSVCRQGPVVDGYTAEARADAG
jgi:NAD(P)H-flavin reductase